MFIGCSSGSGGGDSSNPTASSPSSPWSAYSVVAQSDLPTCSGDIVGRLYYIESTSSFQVCKSTGWTAINVKGNDGSSGLSVVVNKQFSSTATDYCTQNTGENCFFNGGQVVKLSDGSHFITINWSYYYSITGDTDTLKVSKSYWYPASYTGPYFFIDSAARGTGYKAVYFGYDTATATGYVYFDTNGNNSLDVGTDELLYTATTSNL